MRPVLAGVAACLVVALVTAGAFRTFDHGDGRVGDDADVTPAAAVAKLPPALVRAGLQAPQWSVGDAWFVTFNGGDFGCVVAVVSADADGYRQGFACDGDRALAAEEASEDYPFLGEFSPGLAGIMAEDEVVFYDWPLTDGKTWETTWDDVELSVEATYVPNLPGLSGPEPGYALEMVDADGDARVRYDYLPSLGWWSFMRTDGGLDMRVVERGTEWTGAAVTARSEQLLRLDRGPGRMTPVSPPFEVMEDMDWLAITITHSGNGLHDLELRDPFGEVRLAHRQNALLSGSGSFDRAYLEDLVPGGWSARDLAVTGGRVTTTIHGLTFETTRLR